MSSNSSSTSNTSTPVSSFSSFLSETSNRTNKSPPPAGLFGKNELLDYEGFYKLKEACDHKVNALIRETFAVDCKRKLVEIFDDISNELCCVADLAEFVRTSHPNVHFREAANMTFGEISQIVEKLNTNYELYARLKDSLHADPSLDECDKRVCKLFLIDFELSGIHLSKKKRDLFVDLNDQLVSV